MLGRPGQNPITSASGPGRILAIAAAVLLTLGGGYYAWFGGTLPDLGELTFTSDKPRPAQAAPVTAALAKVKIAAVIEPRSTYVIDGARVLTQQGVIDLNARLGELNVTSGPQLMVMTVPNLGGASIKDYALRIANQWGIGDIERNDGVLLLIAPNQKQVRIEVGKGLTNVISDAAAQRIIDTEMLPLFRAGKIEAAAVAGADALAALLRAHPTIGKD